MPDTQPKKRGRPPRIEDARETIIDQAAMIFAEHGVEAATLSDIAGQVGVTKAGVYHYFQSKQDIYDAVILRTLTGLLAATDLPSDGVQTSRDALLHMMRAHARFFEENRSAFTVMLVGFGGMRRDGLRGDALALRRRYETRLRNIIETGITSGEFSETDPAHATRAVLSMLNWMVRWFSTDGDTSAEEFAVQFFDLLMNGLAAKPSLN